MQHNYELEKRRFVIGGLVLLIFLIYILRLFVLQIVDDKYQAMAHNNAFLTKTIFPARGQIYDRNGSLLVYNQPAYDLVVTMREVKDLDTLDLCNTLGITREGFDERMADIKNLRRNTGYSSYTQQTFATQLSVADYAKLQERMYKYHGFEIRPRTIRQYMRSIAPHIRGNIREVTLKEVLSDD